MRCSGKVQQLASSKCGQPSADKRGIQQAVSSFGFYFSSPKHLIRTECSTDGNMIRVFVSQTACS